MTSPPPKGKEFFFQRDFTNNKLFVCYPATVAPAEFILRAGIYIPVMSCPADGLPDFIIKKNGKNKRKGRKTVRKAVYNMLSLINN